MNYRKQSKVQGTPALIFFCVSMELADELWYELESTRFSNMELNRKYIPEMLKIDKNKKFQSSKFLFSKVVVVPNTLRSYIY